MNTCFLLLASILNKLNSQIKIINSLFNFNLNQNKVTLRFQSLRESNIIIDSGNNKRLIFSSKKPIDCKQFENDNKSKNNLIFKEKELNNINKGINIINKHNTENRNHSLRLYNNKPFFPYESSKAESIKENNIKENSSNFNNDFKKNKFDVKNNEINSLKDFDTPINLKIFVYACCNKKKLKEYNLFHSGFLYFKKKLDIIHVFTL